MKTHFIVLVLCLALVSAVSSGRELKQVTGVLGGETSINPTRVLVQSEPGTTSSDSATDPTCRATRTTEARLAEGEINVLDNTRSPTACCVACQGVPNSECRSWWRAEGPNQRCYLNSNRPGRS